MLSVKKQLSMHTFDTYETIDAMEETAKTIIVDQKYSNFMSPKKSKHLKSQVDLKVQVNKDFNKIQNNFEKQQEEETECYSSDFETYATGVHEQSRTSLDSSIFDRASNQQSIAEAAFDNFESENRFVQVTELDVQTDYSFSINVRDEKSAFKELQDSFKKERQ